jgi:glycosyltransferase involved in cell wall biosynthesis
VCYIRDVRDNAFKIHERAGRLPIDYVEVPERNSFDPSIWPALRRLVRDRQIDIVHAHEHKTDLLALLLARVENVIPISTAHGWSGTSLRERVYYFFDRRLLPRYPIVVAVSERIRQTIISCGGDPARIRRIPNGIDHDFFRRRAGSGDLRAELGIAPDAVVVGALGRLEPVKRFDVLLEAVSLLRLPKPPIILLAGEGSCRERLQQLAGRLGLSPRVLWLGHRDDIRQVHEVLDVYVQSSRSEGIPNAVLEAMAMETPVVATNVGGTCELIDHGVQGLLVPADNAFAMAHGLERMITDHSLRRRCTVAARARVEQELSFVARMRKVEEIYDELIQRFRPDGKARPAQ